MIQQGDTNGALADFRKVVELRPDFPMGRYHYGMALEQSGRADEAITQLREAVRLRPEYPPAHGDLGRSTTTSVTTSLNHIGVHETDLLERRIGDLDLDRVAFGPFEIKTIMLER